jgi:hypothetical protein
MYGVLSASTSSSSGAGQHLTHYEWEPGPLVSRIAPPGVAGQPGLRANMPTTTMKVCDP